MKPHELFPAAYLDEMPTMLKAIMTMLAASAPLLLGACTKDPAAASATVQVVPARLGELQASVGANGKLRYKNSVELTSQVIGRVASILVVRGQAVVKDQVVLLLEQAELQALHEQHMAQVHREEARQAQASNNLDHLVRKLARLKNLSERGFISVGGLEDAQFEVSQARSALLDLQAGVSYSRAALRSVKEQLAKTVVRAPQAGVVTSVDVGVGETAIPSTQSFSGASLMTIVEPGSIYLAAQVAEAHVENIQVGQSVTVWLPNAAAAPVTGRVASIPQAVAAQRNSPGAAASSGLFDVQITLDQPDNPQLRQGYNCRAEIRVSDAGQKLLVPVESVIADDKAGPARAASGRYQVWTVNKGTAALKTVALGMADERMQEVRSGLAADDLVVTGPVANFAQLKDGQAVQIQAK